MKLFVYLIFPLVCFSQAQFNISEVDINRNLESLQINALEVDQFGYLWIGTPNGLYRYDGYQAIKIHAEDLSHHLRSTHILSINKSESNQLLIGTDDGFSIYDHHTGLFENHARLDNDSTQLIDNHIHNVIEHKGNLWLATDGGLSQFNLQTKKFTHYIPNYQGSNISFHHVKNVFFDNMDQLWVATTRYLNRHINLNQFQTFKFNDEIQDRTKYFNANRFNNFYQDKQNQIWLATDFGIHVIDPSNNNIIQKYYAINKQLNSVPFIINTIKGVGDNIILFGTDNGLYYIDLNSDNPYQLNLLISHKILSIEPYQNDIVWVGTNAGVYKLVLNPETITSHNKVLQTQNINAVYCINEFDNTLWIGTDKGIFKYDNELKYIYNQNNVKNIIFEKNNNAWFSGMGHELAKYPLNGSADAISVTLENEDQSIFMDNHFMDGVYDHETGKIWFAAFSNGLTSINVTTLNVNYNIQSNRKNSELFNSNLKTLLIDKNRTIIIGSGKGVYSYSIKEDKFTNYNLPYDIRSLYQYDMYYWIGTLKNGLIQTDHNFNIIAQYKKENGLASSHVVKLLAIDGDLWILTNRGLNTLNRKDKSIRRFNYAHNDFLKNSHEFYTMFLKSDGNLYIGSNIGLYSFRPNELTQSFTTPRVNITDIKIDNKSISPSSLLHPLFEVRHEQTSLSFSFACTDYYRPIDNIFRYRLRGLDQDWVEVGNRNFVTYQNIPSGEYVFEVQAANHYGIWSENMGMFSFKVLPPFYFEYWFIASVLVIIIFGIYLYLKSKDQKNKEIERIRNTIATDLHDQIGSTLTEITLLSEMAQLSDKDVKNELQKIETKSRNTISEMGDLVWAINSDKDSFEDLISRVKEFTLNLLSYNDIAVKFIISETLSGSIKPKFRQHIYLIIKELIHNITKHSNANEVEIHMQNNSSFELKIVDNGIGIVDPDKIGNGLNNLRKRTRALHGKIEFINDHGLNVHVSIPKSEV